MEKFDVFSILTLLGGLALFLYGMELMGDGLKRLAGGKLESILSKLTANKFKGFLLGFVVTAIIQSSSATTVMLVGFVNSGIMKLGQVISIVLGANIGTTVTAWLLSSSEISGTLWWTKLFKPDTFTPILTAIGVVIIMMSKSDKKKNIASILLGFGILMFGMDAMSGAVNGLKDMPQFQNLLVFFGNNPVMGILVGTLLTAVIQSSSASVGILQAMSLTGAIPFTTAIPIILGQNIGTTITPVVSAITGNTDSKRVAAICVYTKIIGVIIVATVFYILNAIMDFAFMSQAVTPVTIAFVHTLFNIISTVVLFPFLGLIEKLAIKTIKGKKKEETNEFATLDKRFLDMPEFAVEQCHDIVNKMALITKDCIIDSISLIDNGYNEALIKKIRNTEDTVDQYEDKTSTYLVKLGSTQLSAQKSKEVSELLHVVGDVERISDHSVNICDVAEEIHNKGIEFSEQAQKDIMVISRAVRDIINLTFSALELEDLSLAKKVEPLEQVIDRLKRKIKAGHIERLKEGNCTVELGFVLSDLLTNYERVADHCSNIAVCLLEIANGSFDTHEYLNHVKNDGENDFALFYEAYKAKYPLN
ncbi:MAG: Na/Pi cotransporter family protein [Clostridia bacterium]|nr:Na/Pi cotransporter family protein [Clostridia bacterium]